MLQVLLHDPKRKSLGRKVVSSTPKTLSLRKNGTMMASSYHNLPPLPRRRRPLEEVAITHNP
jgi:hypothetical protein